MVVMPADTGAPVSGGSDDALHTDGGGSAAASRLKQLPNLPMVRHNHKWYRCRTLKTTAKQVQLEFQGFESNAAPFSLPLNSERLWRGSYKGRDWRHLVRSLAGNRPAEVARPDHCMCIWLWCRDYMLCVIHDAPCTTSTSMQICLGLIVP